MPDNQSLSQEFHVFDPERQEIRVIVIEPPHHRYWLHALLFLATIFTTLCIGARMQYDFNQNLGLFSQDSDFWPWRWALQSWNNLKLGIPFSAVLLGILTAHELGHYVLCVRRKVFATLPFFIPAPTLIGTLGAFIRIKSPIRSRADLFDIGIAGPIAGFVVAVPALIYALLASKPLTGEAAINAADPEGLKFGLPLIFKLSHWLTAAVGSNAASAHVPLSHLYLSPMAIAAWVGMFATALNLLPGGQLDGGHIIFALHPRLHRPVSLLCIAVLLPLSWFYWAGWLLWAVVLRFTGGRHPDVPLQPPLNTWRRALSIFALIMLILTLVPAPFGNNAGLDKTIDSLIQDHQHPSQQPQPSQH